MRGYFNIGVIFSLIVLIRKSTAIDCNRNRPKPYHITSQDDADQLNQNNCTIYTGSITIATNSSASISLDGVEEIDGALEIIDSSSLTNFTATFLNYISGNLTLSNLQVLSEINVPVLQTVEGIVLHNLPLLEEITLLDGFRGSFGTYKLHVDISNTSLRQINGFSPHGASGIRIVGNSKMQTLNFSTAKSIGSLEVATNGVPATLDLSSLYTSDSMSLQDIDGVNLPLLEYGGDMSLQNNSFTELRCPSLKYSDGLTIINNSDLAILDLPQLESLTKSLIIEDNMDLHVLQGFGSLGSVDQNITITGNLSSVNLPHLYLVQRGFYISSSDKDFDCSELERAASKNPALFESTYTCRASTTLGGKDKATHWHKQKLSKGAKVGIAVGVVGGVALFGALVWCLRIRWAKLAAVEEGKTLQHKIQD